MTLDLIDAPSPNFDARTKVPDMLVLHYTGMKSGPEALARLRDPEARVSSHYMVEEDGRIFRLVAEERRAWHAGRSFWKGEEGVNHASIGIEIVNPGHEFGYRPFPEAQIAAVIALLTDIRGRWSIEDDRILGHSDVAPARKQDPGELFPWKQLAQAGHGVWAETDPAPGEPLAEGAEGVGVFALQAGLTRLGFDCAPTGRFDAGTREVVTAFQRHWVQSRADGVADGLTRARLMAVLRASG
ncbi:MAG TPA: N-acetylmuramoyl-L-alanine amidase [Caulobacter sp.]|nr:N-acetylmuramoyl-L-alanine amidase [Caulobacter sp.]